MTSEILLQILGMILLFRFVAAPIMRRAIPARYTVRYLLLVMTVLAAFLSVCCSWASH